MNSFKIVGKFHLNFFFFLIILFHHRFTNDTPPPFGQGGEGGKLENIHTWPDVNEKPAVIFGFHLMETRLNFFLSALQ